MPKSREFLNNSMIVAARPGDEALWFSSILPHADEVVLVHRDFWAEPGLGERRSAALAEHPCGAVTCLGLAEAGAHGCADWGDPVLTEHGIQFAFEARGSAQARFVRGTTAAVPVIRRAAAAAASVARGYRDNFEAIREALRPKLKPDMNVFSHNPWGEYGHEENIQIFRVLSSLREEIGFRLWMSNYCSDRAAPLAMRYFVACPGGYVRQQTDQPFARALAKLYRSHRCWRWAADWHWFEDECFMEAPRSEAPAGPHHHLFPLNFFTVDPLRSRNWLPVALTVSAGGAAAGGMAKAE